MNDRNSPRLHNHEFLHWQKGDREVLAAMGLINPW